jgi:hypothetical protein
LNLNEGDINGAIMGVIEGHKNTMKTHGHKNKKIEKNLIILINV